jgi:D-glycero-alpha-D-manno-heptose-7-phosphate kinase
MIISRTPLRVSFFGGGTDYPGYYDREGGIVVGASINKYVYVSLAENSRFFDYKTRISYRKTELVDRVADIEHPSVRACLEYMGFDRGLDINIFSDVPARTGLGSSSSFTVGLLNALWTLKGIQKSAQELAEIACHIEQNIIKENVGSQDQFHAAFGGINRINFAAKQILVQPVNISPAKKDMLEGSWLMFSTGISRYADPLLKEQVEKTVAKKNDSHLSAMVDMSMEALNIISGASDSEFIFELGNLLHQGWEIKKELSSKVSTDVIDTYYTKAIQAGAIGGKLSGAGSGGFLSFFVPEDKKTAVRQALAELNELPVAIEASGSTIIYSQ